MTKITTIYQKKQAPVLSFELFPPKKDSAIESLYHTLNEVDPQALGVDFISVTYGAGGSGNSEKTRQLAEYIQNTYHIPALHHLTGVNQTPKSLRENLDAIQSAGIENILALRGDLPNDDYVNNDYPFAKDLIQDIKSYTDLNVGAAVYPEGHVDNPVTGISLNGVREKILSGTDFLISQLFFENNVFYGMQDALRANYMKIPVSAGIMPIISKSQVDRMTYMIGSSLPAHLIKIVHKYENDPESLQQAGIEYALEQIHDLINNGVDGIHIYAMNRSKVLEDMLPVINQEIQKKALIK